MNFHDLYDVKRYRPMRAATPANDRGATRRFAPIRPSAEGRDKRASNADPVEIRRYVDLKKTLTLPSVRGRRLGSMSCRCRRLALSRCQICRFGRAARPLGLVSLGRSLQAALPEGEDWDVWIDWYNERLRGGTRGEPHEFVFANVPLAAWERGPAAVNAWIREHLPKDPGGSIPSDFPQPLPDLNSPFAYAWNASARVTIVAGAQNLPFYKFFKSEEEHRHSLERCRVSAERLLESLADGRYGNAVRREYAERLRYYLSDLPKIAGVGNIMLADDEVRVLYAMFAQDADALPPPFAAALSRVIANQFALNDFYDVVRRHEQAVNAGNWTQPFPFEAAKAFFGVVDENTPRIFEPEVGHGLHRVEQFAPSASVAPEQQPASSSAIQPPSLPAGAPNAEHSRQRQMATAANALWRVFLKGKDFPAAIEGWTQAAHKLGENVGPILDFLRGLGAPL